MRFVGLDPGVNGGIAALDEAGAVLSAVKMPDTDADVLEVLRGFSENARAVLELVHSSPQMGVRSVWTFGRGYGALRMALCAAGIPYDEVTPQKWQQAMGCRSKGDKNVTKRRAQELFPKLKITHAIADSLLLAEYCRRTYLGQNVARAEELS